MEENIIKVYVKADSNNIVTEINSAIFIQDLNGWVEVDEGNGDKYSHAQGNYLVKGLMDGDGKYNYKLGDSKVVELTDGEKATLFPIITAEPTKVERLVSIENMITMLMGV